MTIEIGGDRVLLPYFTVNIWGDTAYITGGTYADLENTDVLKDILSQCLAQGTAEGTVSDYHLRYLFRTMDCTESWLSWICPWSRRC